MASSKNPFLNRPNSSYIPLADRPIVVRTRSVPFSGNQNKIAAYLLYKPNTLREHIDRGLIYPTPAFLTKLLNDKLRKQLFTRITTIGDIRITTNSDIRVAAT